MDQANNPPAGSPDALLYRVRLPLAALTLLFILYGNVALWFRVPPADFWLNWDLGGRLSVEAVPEDSLARSVLQPGDVVLAIDGAPVRRTQPLYRTPSEPVHTFTVRRGDDLLTVPVPFPAGPDLDFFRVRLPVSAVSLAGWLVGMLTLLFARPGNDEAARAGSLFLVLAAVATGIQATGYGVPGAWIIGYPLAFFAPVAFLYLGLAPWSTPLGRRGRALFALLLLLAAALALAAAVEVLVLFPRPSSFAETVGVNLWYLAFGLSGAGLLATVALLLARALRLPPSYRRRQLAILLFFIALGTLPAVLLTILPSVLLGVELLPYPLAISLLLFIPAGYFFVIYRKGNLRLDRFFGRLLSLVLLALSMLALYAAALHVVDRWVTLPAANTTLLTALMVPILFVTVYATGPFNDLVQQVLYGRSPLTQETVSRFASGLSANPDPGTLDRIVANVARSLNAPRALLLQANAEGWLVATAAVGVDAPATVPPNRFRPADRPLLRAEGGPLPPILAAFPWAEIAVPIRIRNAQIGVWLMARPAPNGFYDARQVAFLTRVADVIAVGTQAIQVFESSQDYTTALLYARELERQRVASRLHGEPMALLANAIARIEGVLPRLDPEQAAVAAALREARGYVVQSERGLRRLCADLHPPAYDNGLKAVAREVVYRVEDRYPDLTIGLDLDIAEGAEVLPEKPLAVFWHVLQEALNNVGQHAGATRARVAVTCTRDALSLVVADDGRGMRVPEGAFSQLVRDRHFGLCDMDGWARLVGGRLAIESNVPQGTRVSLQMPIRVDSPFAQGVRPVG